MERRNISFTNTDIVRDLSTYAWRNRQALIIVSATGYISDAVLYRLDSTRRWRYMGHRRIIRMLGSFEPTDPNGRNENGRIIIQLAVVDEDVRTAVASRLFASGTVQMQIIIEPRPPRQQPPIVVGRRRIQAPAPP